MRTNKKNIVVFSIIIPHTLPPEAYSVSFSVRIHLLGVYFEQGVVLSTMGNAVAYAMMTAVLFS